MKKRQEVYNFIVNFINKNNYSPTIREIGGALELSSTGTVDYHLKKLDEEGLIRYNKGVKRSISLVKNTSNNALLPLMGDTSSSVKEYICVPNFMISDNNGFIFRAKDESMIDAGIFDGDFVVVKIQNTAENGDIVVVRVKDETTIKKIYFKNDEIKLMSVNNNIKQEACYEESSIIEIEGIVVGIMRKL